MRISDWSSDVCSSDLLARNADRAAAEPGDPADDLLVDLAREDHLGNLGGRRVGDAKPADKGRFDAELFQHRADLRPAAVPADRLDAHGLHGPDSPRAISRPQKEAGRDGEDMVSTCR